MPITRRKRNTTLAEKYRRLQMPWVVERQLIERVTNYGIRYGKPPSRIVEEWIFNGIENAEKQEMANEMIE